MCEKWLPKGLFTKPGVKSRQWSSNPESRLVSWPAHEIMCSSEISFTHWGFSYTKTPSSQTGENSNMRNSSFVSEFSWLFWVVRFPTSVTADRHHSHGHPFQSFKDPQFPQDFLSKMTTCGKSMKTGMRRETKLKISCFLSLGTFGLLNIPWVPPHEFLISI